MAENTANIEEGKQRIRQSRETRKEILVPMMQEELKKARQNNEPLAKTFDRVADRSGLKVNTVKNYYYRYLKEFKELADNRPGYRVVRTTRAGNPFSPEEIRSMMIFMLKNQYSGKSVRKCAMELGKDDKSQMLRFQNKYRAVISRYKEYVFDLMKDMWDKDESFYNPYTREKVNAATYPDDYDFGSEKYRRFLTEQKKLNEEKKKEAFLGNVSDLIFNMENIEGIAVKEFFTGLKILTDLAMSKVSEIRSDEITGDNKLLSQLIDERVRLNEELVSLKKDYQNLERQYINLKNISLQFIDNGSISRSRSIKEYTSDLKNILAR